ncbi:uncharacterized protein V6R79_025151 [Siganus canaliculatus]
MVIGGCGATKKRNEIKTGQQEEEQEEEEEEKKIKRCVAVAPALSPSESCSAPELSFHERLPIINADEGQMDGRYQGLVTK